MTYLIKSIWNAIIRLIDQDGVEHAGYMSFIIILAIFPFFVFILALTSFFGASEIGQYLIKIIVTNIPSEATESFNTRYREILSAPPEGLLTLAAGGAMWTASSFIECIRTILNRIYEVTSPPNYIFRRLLSVGQFLLISLIISLLMFALVLLPIILYKIPGLANLYQNFEDHYPVLYPAARYFLIIALSFFTLAGLYYLIPNETLTFKEVIPGALATTGLWWISGTLLSNYLKYYNQLNLVYGSLGSIIVTLIFFYVVNILFIYGAELNYVLNKERVNRAA